MPKTEPLNEDEVKRAAEIREWLESRIAELETEISRMKSMQQIVDSVLRRGSFVPAAELKASQKLYASEEVAKGAQREEAKQLRRSKDGMLIATAFVTPDRVVVIPSSEVKVSEQTPPFQTFFIKRILKGFESADQELASSGKLPRSGILNFQVDEKDGFINKITISNYRDKSRLNEILNTVNWAFTRMLEKK